MSAVESVVLEAPITTTTNDDTNLVDFALVPISKRSNELFNFNSYNKKLETYTNEVAEQIYNLEQISPALVKKILVDNLYKTYKVEKVKKQQAPSSYILFFNDNYQDFVAQNPLVEPKDVAKALGKQWKALSEDQKNPYKLRVEEIKSKIANGTYNPPQKSRSKRRRGNASTTSTGATQQQQDVYVETDNEESTQTTNVDAAVNNKNKKVKVNK